jgi:DNA-binding NtrC family response regulator
MHPPFNEGEEALIGQHPNIEAARRAITALAGAPDRHVMIIGESGTGKALLARAIHEATAQSNCFIPVNCAAVPEHLFEEELWGCPAAAQEQEQADLAQGLLSRAHGGTLFLNDVVAIPDPVQIKLLEVTQTSSYLVERHRFRLNTRIVSSAEPRLSEPFAFHPTLRRVLGATTICLPPLRERRVDIELLANHFLERFAARHPGAPRRLTRNAVNVLLKHQWPGNVRELQGIIGHSAAMCESPELGGNLVQAVITNRTSPAHLGSGTRKALGFRGSLPELERIAILQAFRTSGNNVSEAARLVGLPRSTVRDKLKRYGIR